MTLAVVALFQILEAAELGADDLGIHFHGRPGKQGHRNVGTAQGPPASSFLPL